MEALRIVAGSGPIAWIWAATVYGIVILYIASRSFRKAREDDANKLLSYRLGVLENRVTARLEQHDG